MRYLFPLNPWNQQRQFEKAVWVYPAHIAAYATYLRNEGHEVVWDYSYGDYEKICKCGSRMETACHYQYTYTKSATCFKCNRFVEYGCDFQLWTPKKYREEELWARIDWKQDENKMKHYDYEINNDFQIDVPFDKLPYPDRVFTDAKNKRWQSYGNYKFHPATHMMASNLCWWGKCTFCVDTYKLEHGEKRGLRSVDHVMEEIDDLISQGYREVFDDSGTFPIGDWLDEFCAKMLEKDRYKRIVIGCNMKPIAEKVVPFKLMKEAGFRFILVGVESANQHTIDKIRKGQDSEKVMENLKAMNDAGLEIHLTSMFGYEWESHEDAMNTVNLVHELLKKGIVKTAQASVFSPPRTAPDPNSPGHRYIPMIYDAYKSHQFWYHKIKDIKKWQDFTYLIRGGRLVLEENLRKCMLRVKKPSSN